MAGNQPYNAYLNLNVATSTKYDAGAALLNVHDGAGYKLQQVVQVAQLNVPEPDDTEHSVDPEIIAQSKDEIAIIWYLMMQYYRKTDMLKF